MVDREFQKNSRDLSSKTEETHDTTLSELPGFFPEPSEYKSLALPGR
jgi:hypothetical protein